MVALRNNMLTPPTQGYPSNHERLQLPSRRRLVWKRVPFGIMLVPAAARKNIYFLRNQSGPPRMRSTV